MQPPDGSPPVEIPVAAIGDLHYDEASTGTWSDSGGHHWLLYFFRWKFGPHSRASRQPCISRISAFPPRERKLHEDRGVSLPPSPVFPCRSMLFVQTGRWFALRLPRDLADPIRKRTGATARSRHQNILRRCNPFSGASGASVSKVRNLWFPMRRWGPSGRSLPRHAPEPFDPAHPRAPL